MGLQSKAVAALAAPVLWTTVCSLGSTEVYGEMNMIGLSKQNLKEEECLLDLLFPYRELDFYSCTFWKRYVLRQAGMVVLYCVGLIVRNGLLIFWRIESIGWHGRINIKWLDDEVLTIIFISTLSLKQGREILHCQGLNKPPDTCGRWHIDPCLNISVVASLRWGKAHLQISISSSSAIVQTPLSMSAQHHSFCSTLPHGL